MIRLLGIEFYKLRHSTYFWVLSGLFALMLLSLPFAAHKLVALINSGSEGIAGMGGLQLPFFDFVDIWQNTYFVMKWVSVFLSFIIVISLSNDMNYGLHKQHVIDGLSRAEFLMSKVWMILALALVFTLISVLIILGMGFAYSSVTDVGSITKHIEFVPAYFLNLVAFQLFAMSLALVIKRSGITIAFLLFYVFLIEPIIVGFMMNDGLWPVLEFLPVNAMQNIIRFPFYKYALMKTQVTIAPADLIALLVYIAGFFGLNRYLLTKKDLN